METWQPPRGPKTKATAWIILVILVVCILTMLAMVVAGQLEPRI